MTFLSMSLCTSGSMHMYVSVCMFGVDNTISTVFISGSAVENIIVVAKTQRATTLSLSVFYYLY